MFEPKIVGENGEQREPINSQEFTDPDPHGFKMIFGAIKKGPNEALVNLFRGGDIGEKLNKLKTIRDRLMGEGVDIEKEHKSLAKTEGWRFLDDSIIREIISNCDIQDSDNDLFMMALYVEYKSRETIINHKNV